MSTLNNLRDKRNQLLHEAQRVALAGFNAETRASFDGMLVDVEGLEKLIEIEERAAKIAAAPTTEAIRQNPGNAGVSGEQRSEGERNAIREYVRYGQVSAENRSFARTAETRDLGTVVAGSITTNGGLLVPQSFDNLLHTAQKSFGQIASIVRTKVTDSGATIKVAGADDTTNVLTVIGEDTTVSESDPALSGLTSSTDVCTTGVILVSFAELQDSAFDIDAFIRDSFGGRYWRGVSNMIVNGSSTGNVTSLLSGVTASVTTTAPTAIEFPDLAALYGSLDPAYDANATWAMNSKTRAAVMTVTD